jgi:hypothetical protein
MHSNLSRSTDRTVHKTPVSGTLDRQKAILGCQ